MAFAALAILCDTSSLRISFANIGSSVAFVPIMTGVLLFDHPWPMVIAGVTAFTVDAFVRRKQAIKVVFNTAQYMLAVGVSAAAYRWLGGSILGPNFSIRLPAFFALVATYFITNKGSVALASALSSGVSVKEAWQRIVGGELFSDILASSLSILLAFLYIKSQLLGLALLVVPLFIVRHMYRMNLQLQRVNRELLEVMVKAIEARDPYTSGHSLRVSEYARSIARDLGLSVREVDQIGNAAVLHDVGKIYEEFAPLLRKEGKLTPDERMLMQRHPARSAELAATIGEFRGAVELAIKHHHENYDGTGYPDRLAGEDIPLSARIIMIADTMDAMTTDRPYRKALTFDRTLEELKRFAGKQFDPRLVELVAASANLRRLFGATAEQGGSPVHALGAWAARSSGPWRSSRAGTPAKVG
ncbi:MAG TPA: HD-GYP domain-containing protein [Gemmatimonadales bacterium]|nr:HD-GYP domain-containing protein [Gemmatimonadales bacterium]